MLGGSELEDEAVNKETDAAVRSKADRTDQVQRFRDNVIFRQDALDLTTRQKIRD